MSNVDNNNLFAGAPEGTTHLDPKDHSQSRWIRIDGPTRQYWSWGYWEVPYDPEIIPDTDELIERPKEEVVWDGVGLPPVGCECEWNCLNCNPWEKVTIVAKGDRWIIVKEADGTESIADARICKFRPIQSPAQRHRNELIDIAAGSGILDRHGREAQRIADTIVQWMKDNNLTEK